MVVIPQGLCGPVGVVLAKFATHYNDLFAPDPQIAAAALEFFGSDEYIHWLESTNLDPDLFFTGVNDGDEKNHK